MKKKKTVYTKNKYPISDHALVRYIERVLGMDVNAMKEFMMCDLLENAIKLKAKQLTINGFVYVINDGIVATIFNPNDEVSE